MKLRHFLSPTLALLACTAPAAWGQSSVSLYGILDVNVSRVTNYQGTTRSATLLNSGGRSSSRWGLRGTEDLGGGLAAVFALEADISVDTGQADSRFFGRQSYVGLRGSWGELRVGRDYAPILYAGASVEPLDCCRLGHGSFLSLGNPAAPNEDGRVSNALGYWGTFGKVKTYVQYGLGEVPDDSSAGRQLGANVQYTAGPAHVAFAYHSNHVGSLGREESYLLGGRYAIGNVTLFLAMQQNKSTGTASGSSRNRVAWTGLAYELSPQVELIAGVYRRDTRDSDVDATLAVVGANYKFSPRTEVYADFARVSNAAGASFGVAAGSTTIPGGSQSHTQVGIRHRF